MIIALAILGAAATFILLLAIVILGTRQEPEQIELRVQAPNPLAGTARRLLGVSVRRPGGSAVTAIRAGAAVMDDVFDDAEDGEDDAIA